MNLVVTQSNGSGLVVDYGQIGPFEDSLIVI